MAILIDKLDAYEGQPEQAWAFRKNLAVRENGQIYSVSFMSEKQSAVYSVDGGIIKDKTIQKCDKLILVEAENCQITEIFVELKGEDIRHAISQVEATVNNALFSDSSVIRRHARIIGRRIPRNTGNSITEKAKKRFISKYQCRLEFKTGPYNERFAM